MAKKVWTAALFAILAMAGRVGGGETSRGERGAFLASDGNLATTLLDLGHINEIQGLDQSGDRVLSVGEDRWILWNRATRTQVCDGVSVPGAEVRLTGSPH